MTDDVTHSELLQLLQQTADKPVFASGLELLTAGTEIRLLVDNRTEFALFYADSKAQVAERPAQAPTVAFYLSNEAVRVLSAHPGDNMAQFGIAVVEQVIAGEVQIAVCGSLWRLLRDGYIKIVVAAGPDFLRYLARFGLDSLGKITSLMRSLRP